jgi:putative serine protease PepD
VQSSHSRLIADRDQDKAIPYQCQLSVSLRSQRRMSAPEVDRSRSRNIARRGLLLALVSGLIGAGAVTGLLYATGVAGKDTTIVTAGQSTAIDAAGIYGAAAPGVVDITATTRQTSSRSGLQPFSPPGETQVATGTGFEIDAKGHILTADHVLAGASSVTVRFRDGTSRSAKVLGADSATDAAVLGVDTSGLTTHPLPLGTSHALGVGQPLAVIGDPFNYNRSVSTGIVSALDRTIQAPNGFTIADAIQTDAAINPGNSGGPVLNGQGRVVGITDQIATGGSGADSFSGVGFAVPIDDVKSELAQLIAGDRVAHAYVGLGTGDSNGANGALVGSVQPKSPSSRAGLRAGDLVTAVNGKAIHGANGLISAVQARRPGDEITLSVKRGSRQLTLTVTLATQPGQG